MSTADVELGSVDYVVVAFPAGQANFSGEMAWRQLVVSLDTRHRPGRD